jgi:hypothetical protein
LNWPEDKQANRGDVAYLPMPTNDKAEQSGAYVSWLRSAARILTPGRIAHRPGRPDVPDAFFRLFDRKTWNYGGLSFGLEDYRDIVNEFKDENKKGYGRMRTIEARREDWHVAIHTPGLNTSPFKEGNEKPPKKWISFRNLAGENPTPCPRGVYEILARIVEHSLPKEKLDNVQGIEVWIPGERALITKASEGDADAKVFPGRFEVPYSPEVRERLDYSKHQVEEVRDEASYKAADSMHRALVDYLVDLQEGENEDLFPNAFITMRPVFEKYYVVGKGASKGRNVFDARPTLAEARQQLKIAETSSLFIEDVDESGEVTSVLVEPGMTEAEQSALFSNIVGPVIKITVNKHKDIPPKFDGDEAFHPTDTYRSGEVSYAEGFTTRAHERFVDYQQVTPPNQWALKAAKAKPPQVLNPEADPEGAPEGDASRNTEPTAPWYGDYAELPLPRTANAQPARMNRGPFLREYTYHTPPGLFEERDLNTMPGILHPNQNFVEVAPPIEAVMNMQSDAVAKVVLGTPTLTEAHKLRRDHYAMRNVALGRVLECPFDNCNETRPMNDTGGLEAHIRADHWQDKCNFCDDLLFPHMPEATEEDKRSGVRDGQGAARYRHFIENHRELLAKRQDQRWDDLIEPQEEQQYVCHKRESYWTYCARCGRNHDQLNVRADRVNHDTVCFPGAPSSQWTACVDCGERQYPFTREPHQCEADRRKQYCARCQLDLTPLSPGYRERHKEYCGGHRGDDTSLAAWCPWCGVYFHPHKYSEYRLDNQQILEHTNNCNMKPTLDGPLDPLTSSSWPLELAAANMSLPIGALGHTQAASRARQNAADNIANNTIGSDNTALQAALQNALAQLNKVQESAHEKVHRDPQAYAAASEREAEQRRQAQESARGTGRGLFPTPASGSAVSAAAARAAYPEEGGRVFSIPTLSRADYEAALGG